MALWENLNSFKVTIIDHKIDIIDVDTSTKEVCCYHQSSSIALEEIISEQSFILGEFWMNTHRIEQLHPQYFVKFYGAIDGIREYDNLIKW